MSNTNENKSKSDIQITKEVFRVKYNPPMYIDLTELSDSDSDSVNATHISETCDTAQESGKKTPTNNEIYTKICYNTIQIPLIPQNPSSYMIQIYHRHTICTKYGTHYGTHVT